MLCKSLCCFSKFSVSTGYARMTAQMWMQTTTRIVSAICWWRLTVTHLTAYWAATTIAGLRLSLTILVHTWKMLCHHRLPRLQQKVSTSISCHMLASPTTYVKATTVFWRIFRTGRFAVFFSSWTLRKPCLYWSEINWCYWTTVDQYCRQNVIEYTTQKQQRKKQSKCK